MNLDDYFSRINYEGSTVKCDFQTLKGIFQQHIRSIPFENFSLHCGETIQLELEVIYNKLVRKKRGGVCVENNYLLWWVLKTIGYQVTMLGAHDYQIDKKIYNSEMDHLVLKVVVDGQPYLVDACYGATHQLWEPILLVSGQEYAQAPGIFCLKEINKVWYLDKFKRKQHVADKCFYPSNTLNTSEVRKMYSFTLIERTIEDFILASTWVHTSPDSFMMNKRICTLQLIDGCRTLIDWIFSEKKFNYQDGMDLVEYMNVKEEELDMVLKDKFNLILDKKCLPVNRKNTALCTADDW